MSNFKQKLKAARLPERSIQVCLRGDLAADFEAAERELRSAQESKSTGLEDGIGPIIDRLDALRDEMREHSEEFRLRAMPQPKFRALMAEHPPRRDEEGTLDAADASLGFNRETFFDSLLKLSVVSPELDDDDWTALLDVLVDRQYQDLVDAAWYVNRSEVSVPFSSAASLAKRSSGGE